VYGFVMFLLLIVNYFIGSIVGVRRGIDEENSKKLFTFILFSVMSAILMTKVICFITNQHQFEDICHEFKRLDVHAKGIVQSPIEKFPLKVLRIYIFYVRISMIIVALGLFFLDRHDHLLLPSFYDKYVDGKIFHVTFTINFIQLWISADCLHSTIGASH
jgi:hypothetical protein